MTCEHTGCDVYFEEYQLFFHGDAHRVGDVVIFRLNSTPIDVPPRVHYRISRFGADFDKYSATNYWLVVAESRHAIYYGQDGKTTFKLVKES